MRKIFYLVACLPLLCRAQQPIINSISPTHAEVGQIVTISGSGFTGVTSVFFGGVSVNVGDIDVISDNLMTANVPAGTTHGSITALNTTNNTIGISGQQFYISFGGGSSIDSFSSETTITTNESDAYDICMCDLNNDQLNDIVISHNSINVDTEYDEISIFENQSPGPGTIAFASVTAIKNVTNITGFIATTCHDLNNDGNNDVVFSTNDGTNISHIYVYEGDGAMGLTSAIELRLPDRVTSTETVNRVPKRVKVTDIDRDGIPDIVVGNNTDNTVHIFRGAGGFTFETPDEINVEGAAVTESIEVADLNNDGLPDIVCLPFDDGNEEVYVLKNRSIIGKVNFELANGISTSSRRINIALGDFDRDDLIDIAVTDRANDQLVLFENITVDDEISFSSGTSIAFPEDVIPWGVDLGDINGDGLLDATVACASGDVYVIENTSSGSFTFNTTPVELSTSEVVRNIFVGDLDGDAKPDIAFTHDISLGSIGNLGFFRNENCIVPEISPDNTLGLTFCSNPSFEVSTNNSPGATYNWTVDGTPNSGNTNPFDIITALTSTTVKVEISSPDGLCVTESSEITYTLTNTSTATPTIILSSGSAVQCEGEDITLSTDNTSAAAYFWTLPDGSTATTSEISITEIDPSQAGSYTVSVQNTGECLSNEASVNLQVSTPPTMEIFNNGNDVFCSDGANDPQLEVSSITGLSYQWRLNNSDIATATNATFTAAETGSYSVEITDGNDCSIETNQFTVTEVSLPTASLSGPTTTCADFPTTFSATSTVQSGFIPIHNWIVENESNAVVDSFTGDELITIFDAVGTYEVILTTSYDAEDVTSCEDVFLQEVVVSSAPQLVFSNTDNTKCQLDSLEISLLSPENITFYEWEVNGISSAASSVFAKTLEGEDEVTVFVTITTDIGCQVSDDFTVSNLPTDIDISSPDFDLTSNSVTLEEDNSIQLNAVNAVSDFAWEPESIIENPNQETVNVFPTERETVITLTATDGDGCLVSSSITITLDNVSPRRTFSPNGDGLGFDCWEILNTSDLPGCKVYVFDARGRNISVLESPFENNCAWDGNFNGTPVPEGVYYFVLKCEDTELSKSGSILLAR